MRKIPLARPLLGEEEIRSISETIISGWVTQGPKVQELEQSCKEYFHASYSCAVSSCTAALHLALLSVGVKPGDLVITVSHSFIATSNSIRNCNAEPVFVDIDPATLNMSPLSLKTFIHDKCFVKDGQLFYSEFARLSVGESPLVFIRPELQGRIAAILVVHQIGMPADMKTILKIGKEYSIPVVEDAACAMGSEININGTWEKVGKPHGHIACFSFHPRKVITTGDGGILTTNNKELDNNFRLLRHHGMSISDKDRHSSNNIIIEKYLTTAFNYRMTDIQASCGTEQMNRLESIIRERRYLANIYNEMLSTVDWLILPHEPKYARTNFQSYAVRLRKNAPVSQFDLMGTLKDIGISTKPGIMNAHKEIPYKPQGWRLPASEEAYESTILLPLFAGMCEDDVEIVTAAIKKH